MGVILANPFRCRVWDLHDRLEEHVTVESCKDEIASFLTQGQVVPVLGRELTGEPNYDIELIYGARRLFVARHLNKSLLVDVRKMSDREAIVAMDIENRQRIDVSPYERGLSVSRWLRSGYFDSQAQLARELGMSAPQVSRLIKLSRLPAVVVDAFRSPVEIREEWGLEIARVLTDAEKKAETIRIARLIAMRSPRPPSKEVFRRLISASNAKLKQRPRDEVVRDESGKALFRIRQQRSGICLVMPVGRISEAMLCRIRNDVARIIQESQTEFSRVDRESLVEACINQRQPAVNHRSGTDLSILD